MLHGKNLFKKLKIQKCPCKMPMLLILPYEDPFETAPVELPPPAEGL